jgi:dTDP-4-amino-4,6-dideoxygalactose transaminase
MTGQQQIELALCRRTGRGHAVLVGNGTAGLALGLQALGAAGRPVVLPDSVCLNVPIAAQLAAARPVYAEVQLADLGIDPTAVAPLLVGAGALIAVHGYGSVCALDALQAAADAAGCPLIEDACLAFGGSHRSQAVGSFGAVSVLSFGAGKPISIDHGGAVLTDDAALARELRALDARLPAFTAAAQGTIDDLGRHHTRLYNAHFGRDLAAHVAGFQQQVRAVQPAFLHRFDPLHLAPLAAAVARLDTVIAQRWQHLQALLHQLAPLLGDDLQPLQPTPGAVPWRLNLLAQPRDALLRALHGAGLHASSWHPSAADFLADAPSGHPVAGRIGAQILNLWLDEACTPAYQGRVADLLRQGLDAHRRAGATAATTTAATAATATDAVHPCTV